MSYQSITWNDNDIVTAEKLNQMCANDDYLRDNLPLFGIVGPNGTQSGQLYIQAGTYDLFSGDYQLGPDNRIVTAKVPFPTAFRYRPVVGSSYVSSDTNYREVSVMINGIDGERQPSKNGITVHLTHNKGSAGFIEQEGKYFIHYIAVGIKL